MWNPARDHMVCSSWMPHTRFTSGHPPHNSQLNVSIHKRVWVPGPGADNRRDESSPSTGECTRQRVSICFSYQQPATSTTTFTALFFFLLFTSSSSSSSFFFDSSNLVITIYSARFLRSVFFLGFSPLAILLFIYFRLWINKRNEQLEQRTD